MAFSIVVFFLLKTGLLLCREKGPVCGVQLHFKGTLLVSYEFACLYSCVETGEFFCFLIEIDVIPLPVVPEELFCSISSPFMQPYLCLDLVCCHQESLSLPPVSKGWPSPAAVCLMPTLAKVYFLDNMDLFEATFLPLKRKKKKRSLSSVSYFSFFKIYFLLSFQPSSPPPPILGTGVRILGVNTGRYSQLLF